MEREDLKDDTFFMQMSEGNIGAVKVMMRIIELEGDIGLCTILDLNDMNIRGSQIWVGYKDYCKCDIGLFVKSIKIEKERIALCEAINIATAKGDCGKYYKAVPYGVKRKSSFEDIKLTEKEVEELKHKKIKTHPDANPREREKVWCSIEEEKMER